MMAPDTDLQHEHLYSIARQAQKKAVQARRQKTKRAHRPHLQAPADHDMNNSIVNQRPDGSFSQQRGRRGENKAVHYLQDQGLDILARNIHCRTGEIDIIATDHATLIFVEVRLRASTSHGGAAASVDYIKQRRLIRTAQFFLPHLRARYFAGKLPPCRFDVISIEGQHLHWIKHAFDHTVA